MSLPNVDNVGLVTSEKEFSDSLTLDMTDEEILKSFRIAMEVSAKYALRQATPENLEALRDEALTRLAEEVGVLATLDPAPVLNGEPPILEFIGKVSGDPFHKYGLDHEKKQWEVRKATEKGEDYLGQRETVHKPKKPKANGST